MTIRDGSRLPCLAWLRMLACLLGLCFLPQASAQESLLWGGLQPGSYAVGFRLSFLYDSARRSAEPSFPDYASSPTPRPVLLAMWYPARKKTATRMRFREYLDVPAATVYPKLASRLSRFVRSAASKAVFRKKRAALTPAQQAAFQRLLATPTYASKEAAPADGSFPVLVYHPGAEGSFEDNAVLCEYLASYGYVVISSAYQSSNTYASNNIGDFSRSIQDMLFLLRFAGTLSFADVTRSAGIGHSMGGQMLLQWMGKSGCPFKAVVSLDTTLEYTAADFPGHKEFREQLNGLARPRIPILLFATAERHPNFDTFGRYLRQAPRYEAQVRFLRHDDYLTYGAVRRMLSPNSQVEKRAAPLIRRSYEQVCALTRDFLHAHLQADAAALQQRLQAAKGIGLTLQYRAPE